MRRSSLLVAAALGALALPSMSGGAEVIPRDSGYRMGRRFKSPVRKGGNPAGTKLARKAARGKLGIR